MESREEGVVSYGKRVWKGVSRWTLLRRTTRDHDREVLSMEILRMLKRSKENGVEVEGRGGRKEVGREEVELEGDGEGIGSFELSL